MEQFITRAGETLERLAGAHAGRDAVAILHGGTIRAVPAHGAAPALFRQAA
jgi:broad specificity phosphatase PhoE